MASNVNDKRECTKCTCTVDPGKFEGEGAFTFLAHEEAGNGCGDPIGRYDFFEGGLTRNDEAVSAARDYGYCTACIDAALAESIVGFVVWSTEQGFAECETFTTPDAFDKAKALAEEEEERDDDN